MSTLKDNSHKDEDAVAELSKVIPAVSKALITVVGLSGAAYVVGWFYVDGYFSTFNAEWLKYELSATFVISKSAWPLATLFIFIWLGLLDIKKKPATSKSTISFILLYAWIPLVGLLIFELLLVLFIKTDIKWAGVVSKIIGLGCVVWVASGVHSLIFKSKDNTLGWNFSTGAHVVLIVMGLFMIPWKYGEGAARQDISVQRSSLPRINLKKEVLEDTCQVDIRLLYSVGDRIYAVKLTDSTRLRTQIRLLKYEDILTIQMPTRSEVSKTKTKQVDSSLTSRLRIIPQMDTLKTIK